MPLSKTRARFCPCGFSCPFTSPEGDMKSEKFTPELWFHPGQGTPQAIWWNCPAKVHVIVLQSDCLSNAAAQPRFGNQPLRWFQTQTLTAITPCRFFLPSTGNCPNGDKREGTHISGRATFSAGNHDISHQVYSNVSMSRSVDWYLWHICHINICHVVFDVNNCRCCCHRQARQAKTHGKTPVKSGEQSQRSHQRPKMLRSICPAVAPWDLHLHGVLSDAPASLISSLRGDVLPTAARVSAVTRGPAQVTLPKHTLLILWDKDLKLPGVKGAVCFAAGVGPTNHCRHTQFPPVARAV